MEVVSIVNDIFRLYEDAGQSQYLGENVTKTQHSIQCAMCAEKDGVVQEVRVTYCPYY
jgi:predicted HD phosphohydrolase